MQFRNFQFMQPNFKIALVYKMRRTYTLIILKIVAQFKNALRNLKIVYIGF